MAVKTHQQVLDAYGVYNNPALQAYVQDVGEKLAAKSHRNNLLYRFTVLDSKEVNAFALPGGYIYITRGLLAYLNTEAELAAVLGHEIGHVTARHSVRQYSSAQLANIGAVLGSIFIPGMNSAAGSQLTQLFGTALLRGYGRDMELEADRLGAEYLALTGYEPTAMLDVIAVLKNQEIFETERARQEGREARIYHGVFSTHPDNDTRLQEVVGPAESLQSATQTRLGREPYLKMLDGLVFGDSTEEGISRGHRFYHGPLAFSMSFPKGWYVTNRPDKLLIRAPFNKAVMQLNAEDINKKISPRQFMVERLGLTELGNESPINVHGLEGHTATAAIDSSYGRRIARFLVLFYNNRAWIMAGITEDPQAISKYDADFLGSMKSFHAITENELKHANALKLKTYQTDTGTTFSKLAEQSPLETYAEEQLRLINDYYPKGQPVSGSLIKIIE